jgi:hypothetical protein
MKNLDKDVGVYYKGGCGGFFIFFYILGLKLNLQTKLKVIPIGSNKKTTDYFFYRNFQILNDLKLWKNSEHWPDNDYSCEKDYKKILLYCNPTSKEQKVNCIKINPYIADNKKWRRIQYEKRCYHFYGFTKEQCSYKGLLDKTKKIIKSAESSIIDYCDYSFDFIDFLNYKKSRDKFCEFLGSSISKKSEEYLQHYLKCNEKLTKYIKLC